MPILYAIIGLMVFGLGYSIGRTSATESRLPLDCHHLHCCEHEPMTISMATKINNAFGDGYGKGLRQGMEDERQANRFHRSLRGEFGFDEKMFGKELEVALKPLNELKDRLKS